MKRLLTILFVVLMTSLGCFGQTPVAPASGDGSIANPYTIASLDNLYWIAAPESEVVTPTYAERMACHYIQINDIDASATSTWFSGAGWLPIGNETEKFTGSYDGNEYNISRLTSLRETDYIGLFGIAENVYLRNIKIINADIRGHYYVGILVGLIDFQGNIWNCITYGFALGSQYVGGIAGRNELNSQINFCTNNAVVNSSGSCVGGITGFNASSSQILHCKNTGDINSGNGVGNYIAGIVGMNFGDIGSCSNSGRIGGKNYIAGIAGYNAYLIRNCSNSGIISVASSGSYLGGICGYHSSTDASITKSYNTGYIAGGSLTNKIGGVSGGVLGGATIDNSYNLGRVDAYRAQYVGGAVGELNASYVYDTYSSGWVYVRTSTVAIGGLIGGASASTVDGCFWDTQASTRSTSAGGTGLTTDEMKNLQNFIDANWSFVGNGKRAIGCTEDCWDMDTTSFISSGYPFLGSQSAPITWNGTTDQDWANVANWTGSLGGPSEYKEVIIPNTSTLPTITNTMVDPAKCASLTIETGASLTIAANSALTVSDAITNNGTLQIESDATGTGSFMHNSETTSGTIKVFTSGGTIGKASTFKYHLLSIPLHDTIQAGDVFMGSYLWQFTPNAPSNEAWASVQDETDLLLPQNGYLSYNQADKTYSFAGVFQNGTFTSNIATTITGNYNLIPNPYPSAIDWDAVDLTGSNLESSIWFFDSQSGNYTAYNGGDPAGGNIIPIGQAVFVKASGDNPILQFDNSVRLHSDKDYYKQQKNVGSNKLLVKAISDNLKDVAYIRFREAASNTFNIQDDATKLFGFGSAPQLYTFSTDGQALSINTMTLTGETVSIPVGFEMNEAGEVCLQFDLIDTFDSELEIHLQDQLTNNITNLRLQNSYCFQHQADNNADRFILHFGSFAGLNENLNATHIRCWANGEQIFIDVEGETGQQAKVEVLTLLGTLVQTSNITLNAVSIIPCRQKGALLVRVLTAKKQYIQKLMIF